MSVWQHMEKLRTKNISEKNDYEKKVIRHSATNHAYDLNKRGSPDGNLALIPNLENQINSPMNDEGRISNAEPNIYNDSQ